MVNTTEHELERQPVHSIRPVGANPEQLRLFLPLPPTPPRQPHGEGSGGRRLLVLSKAPGPVSEMTDEDIDRWADCLFEGLAAQIER